jgi:hypothetical protein
VNTAITSPTATEQAMRIQMSASDRLMVATTAESTLMVITAPTTLPRPRHRSNRCMLDAMMPRMASGREMGNTQMEKKSITTDAAMYPVMSALSPFHASMASGRSGFAPRAGNPYAPSMGIATAVSTAPAGATRASGGGPSGNVCAATSAGTPSATSDVSAPAGEGCGSYGASRVSSSRA